MSDDKARDIISRGDRARLLLDDDIFREACAKVEADIIEAWKTWKASDTEGRERLWLGLNMLGKIRQVLSDYATTGRHERRRIEELASSKAPTHLRPVA